MASYGGYVMNKSKVSVDRTKQFWRCKGRQCHGTAESQFGNTVDLTERKAHDRYVESPMAYNFYGNGILWLYNLTIKIIYLKLQIPCAYN